MASSSDCSVALSAAPSGAPSGPDMLSGASGPDVLSGANAVVPSGAVNTLVAPVQNSSVQLMAVSAPLVAINGPVTLPEPVLDPNDPIVKLLIAAEQNQIGISQANYLLSSELEKLGLAWYQHISCRTIGFDPCNRDGNGGSAKGVHELAEDIIMAGWNPDETSHACCVEKTPGDESLDSFNHKFVQGASVPLPEVQPGSLQYGSLACGHTNWVQRCFLFECPSGSKLVGDGTCFRMSHLRQKDALMAETIVQGIKWFVLKWQCRHLYPTLLSLLQSARNVSGHIQRPESEVQGLKRMFDIWAKQKKTGLAWSFDVIKRAALRSRPPWGHDVEYFVRFISTKSGGADGVLLSEFAAWWSGNVPSGRVVTGKMYAAVAACPHSGVAYAILMALYSAPDGFWQGNICTLTNVKQLQAILAKKEKLQLRPNF